MNSGLTFADAMLLKYGKWSGNPNGYPYHPDQCCVEVGGSSSWGPANARQCARKPGHGPNGLYCRQHAPRLEPEPAPLTLADLTPEMVAEQTRMSAPLARVSYETALGMAERHLKAIRSLLASVVLAAMLTPGAARAQWSVKGGDFVAISPAGVVYVGGGECDGAGVGGNGYLYRFEKDGTPIEMPGCSPPAPGCFPLWTFGDGTSGIAVDAAGDVWEAQERTVVSFSADGLKRGPSWQIYDLTTTDEPSTRGVAIDALGRVCVIVANDAATRVEIHATSGADLGSYLIPAGRAIAADAYGGVYVAGEQVVEYTSAGAVVRQWGSPGSAPGQFLNGPTAIAVGPGGDVYVVDEGNARVQVFTADGNYLRQFGIAPGCAYGIAIDEAGGVYVSNGSGVARFGSERATRVAAETWGHLKARYR